MEQSLYLLLGAGAFIFILSLFIKSPASSSTDSQAVLVQKQLERAEMEKTLQRFVHQVKKENELVLTGIQKKNEALQSEMASLHQRLAEVEQENADLRRRFEMLPPADHSSSKQEDESEDALLLRERYRRVFELKEQGLTIDDIAKRLGAGQGEIELIFSLASPTERGTTHA